jgi:hypothetical protein
MMETQFAAMETQFAAAADCPAMVRFGSMAFKCRTKL